MSNVQIKKSNYQFPIFQIISKQFEEETEQKHRETREISTKLFKLFEKLSLAKIEKTITQIITEISKPIATFFLSIYSPYQP